jgi:hypothetical protein
VLPSKQPSGQLKVVPLTDDANIVDQLAASIERIAEAVNNIGAAVDVIAARPAPTAVLKIDGPEPAWVHELRDRHANAKHVGSSVCVIQRETVAHMITLIDLARKTR